MTQPATYELETLQSLMVTTLIADPMFDGSQSANGATVPILTEAIGDLVTQVGISIGSMGLCLVVRTPLFQFVQNLAPSLDGWAPISVDVFEDVTLNQSTSGTRIRRDHRSATDSRADASLARSSQSSVYSALISLSNYLTTGRRLTTQRFSRRI